MRRGLVIAAITVALIVVGYLLSSWIDLSRGSPRWGATFSQLYAEELGLDWRAAYTAILDELPLTQIRLVAQWDRLEPSEEVWRFRDLDWQVEEARKRNKDITLVVGFRVPRWPECHIPSWTAGLPKEKSEKALFDHLNAVVSRYKPNPAVKIWQVENEPLLSVFGRCPKPDRELLKREIALVKSLDPSKPIMVTVSGELALGTAEAGLSEMLGTTLYRVVWNKYIGHFKHVFPPTFYAAKAFLLKTFSATEEVVISELQAEPWAPRFKPLAQLPLEEQIARFDTAELKENIEFAKKTGIKDIYLWGVEWWYFRKQKGDDSFWQTGKELLTIR